MREEIPARLFIQIFTMTCQKSGNSHNKSDRVLRFALPISQQLVARFRQYKKIYKEKPQRLLPCAFLILERDIFITKNLSTTFFCCISYQLQIAYTGIPFDVEIFK